MNTQATSVTTKRGKKLGFSLTLNTEYQSLENLKRFRVTESPSHTNKKCILKRINETKSFEKLFSLKSETDDGLSSCSNFPERTTDTKPVAKKISSTSEIEHLKGKTSDEELDTLRLKMNWNADVFSKHKDEIVCRNFVKHEIQIEKGSVSHRE